MRKPYVDPFPNLPRRFGSFREVDAPAEKPAPTKPAKAAKKATKRKPKRKAKT